jgi:hypothetical protein
MLQKGGKTLNERRHILSAKADQPPSQGVWSEVVFAGIFLKSQNSSGSRVSRNATISRIPGDPVAMP